MVLTPVQRHHFALCVLDLADPRNRGEVRHHWVHRVEDLEVKKSLVQEKHIKINFIVYEVRITLPYLGVESADKSKTSNNRLQVGDVTLLALEDRVNLVAAMQELVDKLVDTLRFQIHSNIFFHNLKNNISC